MDVPASLKSIKSYMQRAKELDGDTSNPDSKVVAYYCRTYAMEKAMKSGKDNEPDVKNFLLGLLTALEKDKLTIPLEDRRMICEQFAFNVFQRADNEDRSGNATKVTAKTFYAAGTFLDILEQFGELDMEIQEKRRYAKFKAADIINAINSGVKPTPGAPGEEEEPPMPEGVAEVPASTTEIDIPAAPTFVPQASIDIPAAPFTHTSPVPPHKPAPSNPAYPNISNINLAPASPVPAPAPAPAYIAPAPVAPPAFIPAPVPAPAPAPTYTPAPRAPTSVPSGANDPRVKDAIELASFAIAAMKHHDINLAKSRLQEALKRLG